MKKYIILFLLCGCMPKPSGEICDMAKCCFDKKQGVTIIFAPQPESKQVQYVDISAEPNDKPKK